MKELMTQVVSYRIVANEPGGVEAEAFMRDRTKLVARIKTRFEVKPGDRLKFHDGVALQAEAADMGDENTEVIEAVEVEAPRPAH